MPWRPCLKWLGKLSREDLNAMGGIVGAFWYAVVTSSRRLGLSNLDLVYGDSIAPDEKLRFCRESFKNILKCMLDYYHFSFRTDSIMDLVTMDRATEEKMRSLVESGQGVLVFSSHLGNWEMLAAYFARFVNARLLARSHDQFKHFVEDCRSRYNVGTYSDNTLVTMKKIVLGLKKGEFIGFVLDRNIKNTHGMMIDFMGPPAFPPFFPVKLALKSGVPVVGRFMVPEGGDIASNRRRDPCHSPG
jgi:KDO2-lipid IV(A) lauroyltransferase